MSMRRDVLEKVVGTSDDKSVMGILDLINKLRVSSCQVFKRENT